MKTLPQFLSSILLLMLLATSPSAAEESLELGLLREKRDAEIAKINELYRTALTALKKKLTKTGRIEDALAVKAELDKQPTTAATTENQLIGRWDYPSSQGQHSRVFTADTITLYRGKKKVWTLKYRLISPTFALIDDGQMTHELKEDGKLHIQGKYAAKRVDK